MAKHGWIVILLAGLPACAVGPDYEHPDVPVPDAYVRADGDAAVSRVDEAEFWRGFGDPLLAGLVDQALAANHDLRVATARYDQARALLRGSRLDRRPTVTAEGFAGARRSSSDQMPGLDRDARDSDSYQVGIEAAWELDLFGRVRRGVEAQRAEVAASAADLAAIQVAVVAELTRNYYQLRGLQERLSVAREHADNQRSSLELVRLRQEAGRGTEFDVARARAQLESTRSRIPALEAEVAAAVHRIGVLTGGEPGALVDQLEQAASLPELPARVAVGLPAELLRRRPDVRAAERRLAAATARIGVATGDLFPRLTLGAAIGSQAVNTGALFERDSETRLIGLGIDWSFLDVGRVRARIAAADAAAAENLARYEQVVLLALEETENALVRHARLQHEQTHLAIAAAASNDAAHLARMRFEGGVASFLEVLDAERSQLEVRDELVQSQTRVAISLVALYRALAGGWFHGQGREGGGDHTHLGDHGGDDELLFVGQPVRW